MAVNVGWSVEAANSAPPARFPIPTPGGGGTRGGEGPVGIGHRARAVDPSDADRRGTEDEERFFKPGPASIRILEPFR